MAALEKIRKRAVILTVVIGLGLLAFIVEDGVQAARSFFNDQTAAKVGSDKIDIMEFPKRSEKLNAQNQNQQQKQDPAVEQQQLLDEMVFEKLLDQEYDKVGIYVSDSELSEALTGKNPAQVAVQFAQQLGVQSPAQAYDFITNPTKYKVQESQVTEIRAAWNDMQDQVYKQLLMQKLYALVDGSMQANDLDRKQMQEDGETTCYINFVKKDFSTLADDKYPVSDSEIKAEYDKEKELFAKDEDVRNIHYISVDITPSKTDLDAATKQLDNAYAKLQAANGVDQVRTMADFKVDTPKVSLNQITDQKVKDFVKGASVGAVYRAEAQNNVYNMYKLTKVEQSLDSVNIASVVVQGDKKLQDSVLNMLNSGKAETEVAKVKGVQVQAAQWQQIALAPDSLKNKISAAGSGYVVLQSQAEGAYLCKVVEKKAPKTYYTIATVTYEAYASQKTIDGLRDKLQKFVSANTTASAFAKNAAKAGYNAVEIQVTPSTPEIGYNPQFGIGLRDTRKAIKWAFDAKVGDVSPIFDADNNNALVVVCLDAVYDGGYFPVDYAPVKKYLTEKVRNSKKGDDLTKQFEGKAKDLQGYAKLMGCSIDTTEINFAQDQAMKIDPSEGGLIGRVAAAKVNAVVGPWKGNSAVWAFQVVKAEKSQRKPAKQELDAQFARTRGSQIVCQPQMLYSILSKATKVKKNLIKFY